MSKRSRSPSPISRSRDHKAARISYTDERVVLELDLTREGSPFEYNLMYLSLSLPPSPSCDPPFSIDNGRLSFTARQLERRRSRSLDRIEDADETVDPRGRVGYTPLFLPPSLSLLIFFFY